MVPKVEHLGAEVGAPRQVLDVFVDEILRGSALFSVSLLLKRLEPVLRETAQLPPWHMVSAVDHPVQGNFRAVGSRLRLASNGQLSSSSKTATRANMSVPGIQFETVRDWLCR